MQKLKLFLCNIINTSLSYMILYFIFNNNLSSISILGMSPYMSILFSIIILSFILTILFNFNQNSSTIIKNLKTLCKLIAEACILSIFTSLLFDLILLQMIADIQNIILSISISKLFIITFAVCFIFYITYSLFNYAAGNKIQQEQSRSKPNLFLVPIFYSCLFYLASTYIDSNFPGLIEMIFQFSPLNAITTLVLFGGLVGVCLYFYKFSCTTSLLNEKHLILLIKIIGASLLLTTIMTILNTQAIGIIQTSGFFSLFSQNSFKLLIEPFKINISSAAFISTATILTTNNNDYDYTYFKPPNVQQ